MTSVPLYYLAIAALVGFIIAWVCRTMLATADQKYAITGAVAKVEKEKQDLEKSKNVLANTIKSQADEMVEMKTTNGTLSAEIDVLLADQKSKEYRINELDVDLSNKTGSLVSAERLSDQMIQERNAVTKERDILLEKLVPTDLTLIDGIGNATAEKLQAVGIETVAQIAQMSASDMAGIQEAVRVPKSIRDKYDWVKSAQGIMADLVQVKA